jgi:hypothetical protein
MVQETLTKGRIAPKARVLTGWTPLVAASGILSTVSRLRSCWDFGGCDEAVEVRQFSRKITCRRSLRLSTGYARVASRCRIRCRSSIHEDQESIISWRDGKAAACHSGRKERRWLGTGVISVEHYSSASLVEG